MNLSESALNNRALVKFLIVVLIIGGVFSFFSITRKPLISLSIRSFHNFLYDTTTVSTFLG